MASIESSKIQQNPNVKLEKASYFTQIFLRSLVIMGTLAAMCVMLTNKQSTVVFGISVDARYNYASAFIFSAIANAIACGFTILSLFFVIILSQQEGFNPTKFFLLFLHDLIMMSLVMAGGAAATAIGFVGKYGNDHIGWIAICDNFGKFCDKIITSMILSFLSFFFLFVLIVISASKDGSRGGSRGDRPL